MKELRYLNTYFATYKYQLILGTIITIIARIFLTAIPTFVGDSLNVVEEYQSGTITELSEVRSALLVNIGYIFGVVLIGAVFTFLMRQTFIVVSRKIEFDLKNEVYQHYQQLSLNFYKQNRTGDLMNRISEDVTKVRMYVGPALMYSVNTLTMFVVVIIYMVSVAPTLTLYTLAPLPILSVLVYRLSVTIHKRSTIVQEYLSQLTTYAQETFSGIAVIKAYGLQPRRDTEFKELSEISKVKNIRLAQVQALFFPLMVLLIGISSTIVIYIGGRQFINGTIDEIGIIAEFTIFVTLLTWPVATVGWVTSIVQRAAASQARINEFLNTQPEITNPSTTPTPIEGYIRFDDVTFTYDDTNITALRNLSFELRPGETLAIIGKTGSGKSTVLDLIGRLYDVEKGTIYIDQKPIETLNLYDLRKSIGYVPQDAFLFSDTIGNNIRFGKEDASDTEITEAAIQASVHHTIKNFSKAYDTVLGERGITLSGGQKQRVSIARAIIKDPKILLFDDCLSAVDTETEEEILTNLNRLSHTKTTLIVSHRISAARNADQIIVLDEGTIIQHGTHETLVEQEGYYKELYTKQLSEEEI